MDAAPGSEDDELETQQILIVTQPRGGDLVAEAVEAAGLEDVVATNAGYSSVVVYTENKFFQEVVWGHLMGDLSGERDTK